jgi:hypothetical protein
MDTVTLILHWAANYPWWASAAMVTVLAAVLAAWRVGARWRRQTRTERVSILPPERHRDWHSTIYNPAPFRRPKR